MIVKENKQKRKKGHKKAKSYLAAPHKPVKEEPKEEASEEKPSDTKREEPSKDTHPMGVHKNPAMDKTQEKQKSPTETETDGDMPAPNEEEQEGKYKDELK